MWNCSLSEQLTFVDIGKYNEGYPWPADVGVWEVNLMREQVFGHLKCQTFILKYDWIKAQWETAMFEEFF